MARASRRPPTARQSLGARAEARARRFLKRRGLNVVERNFRTRRGELDLVMLDDDCLVFVEVRYRGQYSFVAASLTVDERKQRKLIAAASEFLARNPQYVHCPCRFDVVGVDTDGRGRHSLQWIRDAFRN